MWYSINNIDLSTKTILERREFLLRLVLIGFVLGIILILIKWLFFDRSWVTTDNAFVTGNLININSDATGVIEQIFAEETQLVKKDEILVKLDGQRAAANLGQAEADLARAVRSVGALFASRRQVCQKINSRSASRERTRHDIVRFKYAVPSGAASPQQL
ncbi:MAG: biotin/lipoyl-binding protein, partial [Methylocystis sp.]